jgi:hypothetical protein
MWIENRWGTGWGNQGYAELSWAFVNQGALETINIVPSPHLDASKYDGAWVNVDPPTRGV